LLLEIGGISRERLALGFLYDILEIVPENDLLAALFFEVGGKHDRKYLLALGPWVSLRLLC